MGVVTWKEYVPAPENGSNEPWLISFVPASKKRSDDSSEEEKKSTPSEDQESAPEE